MTPEEIKYFLKYVWKEFFREITSSFKAVTNLARPKLWLFVFSAVLLYQLILRRRFETMFTLIVILFIWMWDYWEAGHWRGDLRRERMEKLREQAKKEKSKDADEDM